MDPGNALAIQEPGPSDTLVLARAKKGSASTVWAWVEDLFMHKVDFKNSMMDKHAKIFSGCHDIFKNLKEAPLIMSDVFQLWLPLLPEFQLKSSLIVGGVLPSPFIQQLSGEALATLFVSMSDSKISKAVAKEANKFKDQKKEVEDKVKDLAEQGKVARAQQLQEKGVLRPQGCNAVGDRYVDSVMNFYQYLLKKNQPRFR